MKKFLVSALMLIAASTATFAQHAVGSLTLQPKVGVNIASLTKSDGADPRWGFVGGAEFEYQATDIFSLSAGLLYSMQGNKYKDGGSTYTCKLDYLNIPILANVYMTKGLAVKVGLQPAINVNASEKTSAGNASVSRDFSAKDFELSIPIGLSYELPSTPLVIDARYNWGVTKVVDDDLPKNSVFQFTIGYKFSL